MLLAPTATFRRIRSRWPFLGPWLTTAVALTVLSLVGLSIAQRAAAHMLAGTARPDVARHVAGELERMRAWTLVAVPAGVALRWAAVASGVWAVAVLGGVPLAWRAALSIVAVSSGVEVLGRAVDVGVAWTVGPELGDGLLPMNGTASSLAALFPAAGQGTWVAALLDQVTPFTVGTVAFWYLGLRAAADVPRVAAGAAAILPWLVVRLVGATTALLGGALAGATAWPGG